MIPKSALFIRRHYIMRLLALLAIATAVLTLAVTRDGMAAPQMPRSMAVELQKGRMVNLPQAAASVLVANPDIADVEVRSPRQIFIFGRAIGETTLYAYDAADNQILATTIQVTHNLSALQRAVRDIVPEADVRFRSTDRGIVAEGEVNSPASAEKIMRLVSGYTADNDQIINMLNVKGSEQVALRVRFAEVARTNLENFGVNFQNLVSFGDPENFGFLFARGRDFIDESREAGQQFLLNPEGDTVQFTSGILDLNPVIDALVTDGMANLLAEPNLTTISGRPASFLAGGEVPIPVPGDDGTVTIQYRQFGVSLNFTPTVMSKDRISLQVQPEVSAISNIGAIAITGFQVPSFSVRRASATVEVGSGQSIAIAGLLQNDINNEVSKFPWLGDVPVLGALFRSTSFQRNETELVIVVTPYIVRPISEDKVSLPSDNIVESSDFERIFLGKLYSRRNPSHPANANTLAIFDDLGTDKRGKIGYIVE